MEQDKTLAQRIGTRIAAIRASRGIGQKQLAEKYGLSSKTLSDLENGKIECRISTLEKLEDALEFTTVLIPNEDLK